MCVFLCVILYCILMIVLHLCVINDDDSYGDTYCITFINAATAKESRIHDHRGFYRDSGRVP